MVTNIKELLASVNHDVKALQPAGEDWTGLTATARRAAYFRMEAWSDLIASGCHLSFESAAQQQALNVPGLQSLPIPVVWKEFKLGEEEAAGRRVGEAVEGMLVEQYLEHGLEHPLRDPASPGWEPKHMLEDVLSCLQVLMGKMFYGPWIMYHTQDWDRFLDDDWPAADGGKPTRTLRQELCRVEGVKAAKRHRGVPQALFVHVTPDVARAVTALDVSVIKHGEDFVALCMVAPQIRRDWQGNCGILKTIAPSSQKG